MQIKCNVTVMVASGEGGGREGGLSSSHGLV